ncbi:MAG: DUF4233 domain-containing protein [Actinobacteria bacterium]|nr:DUF4233 domain-containing protein [Actinomycetota bacterium]MCB9413239.1 DUF4233 domain-containing protein [Actinomycetota bacterium]
MKVLGASVLIFEAIVMGLFIPVAYFNGMLTDGPTAAWLGGGLAVMCLVGAGLVRRPFGVALGWVIQGLIIATGLLVPVMFALGAVFALLWWSAVHFGRRADSLSAGRAARDPQATPTAGGQRSS